MRDLKEIRKDINEIDGKIRELWAKRMSFASEVADYKKSVGLPIFDKDRETEIIRLRSEELDDEALRPFYINFLEQTMAISRNYQQMLLGGMRVAYSGVTGAFAYIASCKLFPKAKRVAYPNFEEAYAACVSGECDAVVLPIENSYNGEVGAVTDLMFSGSLWVNGIVDVDISHCLLSRPEAKMADITRVISHPQALAQCKDYIRGHAFAEEEAENTAIAAELVADSNDTTLAAIASEEAARIFGLKVLEKNINSSRTNTTRFAVFSRTEHRRSAGESGVHSILLFTVRNEAGGLAKALNVIGRHGFNMRTLRSRPMKSLLWQYYFYLEIEGDAHSKEGCRMLEDLEEFCDKIKIVGSYVM